MKVIYLGDSKRLVHKGDYEVERLLNDGKTFNNGRIKLVGINHWFDVKQFVNGDGSSIQKINYGDSVIENNVKFEDLNVGDILVCKSTKYKTLIEGSYYEIEEKIPLRWGGKVKFKGINQKFNYYSYYFRKLTKKEIREAKLNDVLYDKKLEIVKTKPKRKIEHLNKNKILIQKLAESINDRYRHKLSIIDWTCDKLGKTLGLRSSDYDELLEMKLVDILKIIEENP